MTAVIPCRNGGAYVAEAIDSVRAQSRPATEIIVVDDASTDDSAETAAAAGARVMRHAMHRGNGAARNTGVRAAHTPFVAFLDADDAWLPEHLATVVPLLERHPTAGAAFSALRDFGVEARRDPPARLPFIDEGDPQWLFERCLATYVGQPSACLIRRALVLEIGGFSETLPVGVDFDMWLRLSRRAPFVASHAVTVRYRRHSAQISGNVIQQEAMCFRARRDAWLELRADADNVATSRAAEIIRDAWEQRLAHAWDGRRLSDLRDLVALADLIPDGDALRRRWARRATLPRVALWAWDHAGESVRGLIRRARRLIGDDPL